MDIKREWLERDYYATLGVSPDASDKEIQSKYRELARELHPDRNPDDQTAEAGSKKYQQRTMLSKSRTRNQYDDVRRMGPRNGRILKPRSGFGNLGDLLNGMFGGSGNPFGSAGRHAPSKAPTNRPNSALVLMKLSKE